jgi:hypothetical protein
VLFSGYTGESRNVVITYGGSKTSSFAAFIQKYDRIPKLGALTEFSVTLQPSGTVTEA